MLQDDFYYYYYRLGTIGAAEIVPWCYPRLIALHLDNEQLAILSSKSVDPDGAYLLDCGDELYVWIGNTYTGREVSSEVVEYVLGLSSFEELQSSSALELNPEIAETYRWSSGRYQSIKIVLNGDKDEGLFFAKLIEDRKNLTASLQEFLSQLSS